MLDEHLSFLWLGVLSMANMKTTPLWRITAYTHDFTTPAQGMLTHLTQNKPGLGQFGSAPDKAAVHSKKTQRVVECTTAALA